MIVVDQFDGSRMPKTIAVSIALVAGALLALPTVSAQARDEYVIVGPTCGVDQPYLCKDPAERARYEQRAKDRQARQEAQARAAEAARLKREADIKAIMKSMNLSPAQEADARRLYEMRQAAQAAMPKPPGGLAQASTPKPDDKFCPNRRSSEEIVQVTGLRQPTQALAMASLSSNPGVYDARCSGNDFGWQCVGKRKTGKTVEACVGGAAQ
ncbi:hypothetical protein ASD38_14340 [Caulobacter sp. Root487D2Y]|nr:hypothetical protein ASD38_14340 [Caulobacter sp. Root487D2Y]